MTTTRSTRSGRRPAGRRPVAATPHRSAAPWLDPYTITDTTLTLQEWTRSRGSAPAVHVVLPQSDQPLVA